MRNPFRSEAAALRFLLVAAAAVAALTVLAAVLEPAAAVVVASIVGYPAVALYALRGRHTRVLATAPAHVGPADERRLLVLAQKPVPEQLLPELRDAADRVLVVSAPVASRLRRWTSERGEAHERARRRVDATVSGLRALNADASGVVGDDDPVQALEDALRTFGGDAIAVAAPPRVVARIRERYALPVTHLGV